MCIDTECLCDVTPRGDITISVNAVHDMWQGERIAEILRYPGIAGWDNTKILHYLTTVTNVHDKFIETSCYGGVNGFESIEPLNMPANMKMLNRWKMVRDSVKAIVNQYPTIPILVILAQIGVSLHDFIQAVTGGKAVRYMNETEFSSFNAELMGENPNFAGIGRRYQTGVNTMNFYKTLYKKLPGNYRTVARTKASLTAKS